jgi:hypothetical protein
MKNLHKKSITREIAECMWMNPDAMSGRRGGRVSLSANIHASLDDVKNAKEVMERWEKTVNDFIESLGEEAEEIERG